MREHNILRFKRQLVCALYVYYSAADASLLVWRARVPAPPYFGNLMGAGTLRAQR